MIALEQQLPAPGPDRTVTPHILSPQLQRQYEALRVLLQRALWLAEKRADHEATQILRARLGNLQAPALLVIVGEVKAGKSSFVNALVREDVSAVAPGPCTTRIQELVYGVERQVASLGPSWERVSLPKEVLRELTIVDTPGTNSIIKDHQTITENYIPQSDLVVFVFSAVNPHTKSAWELLTLVRKEWRRKMVFVLQQADRASPEELKINREDVCAYARDRHVADPTIFTLSAKQEMEGRPESGFEQFRYFLRNAIARGDVWRIKVEGSYETIRTVTTRLLAQLRAEQEALDEERTFYRELLQKVEAREAKAQSLKHLIIERLSLTYDRLAKQSEDQFVEGLRVGRLFKRATPFLRDKHLKAWLEELDAGFEKSALKQIALEAPQLSHDLSEEMHAMVTELAESIARRRDGRDGSPTLPQTGERLELLAQLEKKLQRMRVRGTSVREDHAAAGDVRKLALAGVGLAMIGVIIAALAQSAALGIAGAIFAALGALLAAAGLVWRRSDILRDFRHKLANSRAEFYARLQSQFSRIFDGLFYDVRQTLTETIFRLDLHASHIAPVAEETFRIGEAASELLLNFQRDAVPPPAAQM